MTRKFFAIKASERTDIPMAKRAVGMQPTQEPYQYINQALFEANRFDHILGTVAQVTTLGLADIYFDNSDGTLRDVSGAEVTLFAGATVYVIGLDTLTADFDMSAYKKITFEFDQSISFDNSSHVLIFGDSTNLTLLCDNAGNVTKGIGSIGSVNGVDLAIDHIVGTTAQVNAGQASLKYFSMTGVFKNADNAEVSLADNQTINMIGHDTLMGNFDVSAYSDQIWNFSGFTFSNMSYDVKFGDSTTLNGLTVTNTGNLSYGPGTAGDVNGTDLPQELYVATSTTSQQVKSIRSDVGGTGTQRFHIEADGDVKNTNNSYGAISDETLKENITDTTDKLPDLMNVRVRNFTFRNDPGFKQIGVVAQELETVFPGLVSIDENGIKSVKYSVLVPILIKALQESSVKVDDLADKAEASSSEVADLIEQAEAFTVKADDLAYRLLALEEAAV
ncbi:MAG: hypothetical protein HN416_15260 [Nitrospina sp.]|jgi:hypothetical protein|nr:hypothetical protein [Nitrospina sp.]